MLQFPVKIVQNLTEQQATSRPGLGGGGEKKEQPKTAVEILDWRCFSCHEMIVTKLFY